MAAFRGSGSRAATSRSVSPVRQPAFSRRAFNGLLGAAAATQPLAGFGTTASAARSMADQGQSVTAAEVRRQLAIQRAELNPDDRRFIAATTVDGSLPGPEIRVREGDLFRAEVSNRLDDQPATIHWHGLLVPAAMDGVPNISQVPIPAGEIFTYEFPLLQSGTYWYHSHYQLQEQLGLAGPFIIEAKDESLSYDRDYVVMLSDWLHSSPYDIIPNRRRMGAQPSTSMERMAMDGGPDLSDVNYDSFLLNGHGNQNPWACVARSGERVRLRVINGAASTIFRFMIDGHALHVTHADGPPVSPIEVDNILIGMAECYDVLVHVRESGSYTLRAQAQDGSGQAVGVLHTPDVPSRADLNEPKWGARQLTYGQLEAATPVGAGCAASPLRTGPYGRHDGIRLVDQRPSLSKRRSTDRSSRRARAGNRAQPNAHVAPDAPARPLLSAAIRPSGPQARPFQAHGQRTPRDHGGL
jgi:FtsP/CotA-like multicopper oxidase with cupredoxin domain